MASRKRIKVVRGFRGTRHHGLAPGRKAKPIIKESCSPALGHRPGRVPPVSPIPLMATRNDLCKRVAQEVMDRFAIGGD